MKTRRSFKQWWSEARCHYRIIRTLARNVEHYPYCGAEHRKFWDAQ